MRWIYPVMIGDMSIGALSWRMWEALALAVAYLNEECDLPVRMCSGEGGMPVQLLTSEYLKYMIIQIASGHFGWNRIIKAMPQMVTDPAAILIKIGQGAKPGDGGLLPAEKVAPHIQAIRGVPHADLLSPPNHQGLYSIEESVQKMFLSMNAAFQFRVPVAIKVAASSTSRVGLQQPDPRPLSHRRRILPGRHPGRHRRGPRGQPRPFRPSRF